MMFKAMDGSFVNLSRAGYVNIRKPVELTDAEQAVMDKIGEKTDPVKVFAWMDTPNGVFYSDGSGEIIGYEIVMFEGTLDECESYMEWLGSELDVKEYQPPIKD